MSLYKKTATGIKWSFISTFGNMVVQFVAGVVLARLLLPRDYGLMGMALVVIAISNSVSDSGLYQALIQKKDAAPDDFSVVFKFNLRFSLILVVLIFFFSEAIAKFYNQTEISSIIKLLAILVIVDSFSIIQRASLIKDIRFDLISKIDISANVLSSGLGIGLAIFNFGVWSLVFKELVYRVMTTVLYWLFHPVKINIHVPWTRFRSLLNFGSKIFIADQIESLSNQLAKMLIGKKYSANDLGFYTKAEQFQNMFSQTAAVSVNRVVFPSFSQIQHDDEKLKKNYQILIKTTMLFLFPIMFTAILIADKLIPFLLGVKWVETIPYFQILCVGGMVYPFTIFNLNIVKVKGRSNLYLKICLFSKGLLIPAVLIGLQFHVIGLVYALLIQRICAAIINSYYSGKLVDYRFSEQLKDVSASFFISTGLFFVVFLLIKLISMYSNSNLLLITSGCLLMFTGYLLLQIIFNKSELLQIRKIITDAVKK